MKLSRFLTGALTGSILAAAVVLSSGCFIVAVGAAAGAGAGTVAYIRGELDATVDANFDVVVRASNAALGQLHIVTVSQAGDSLSTVITARTEEDTKLTVTINRVAGSANATQVKIRIGVFGNEPLSRSILDEIKRDL